MHLQKRVVRILTNPRKEWAVIAAESGDVASIYRNYVVVLAAVPSVCMLIRSLLSGVPLVGVRAAIGGYLAALGTPVIAALVIEKLAPRFQSTSSTLQALKLVAYSSTPIWIAGVLILVPGLASVASLVGLLYAIYLFYLGLAPVVRTPSDQIVPFVVVCALALLVINIVLSFVFSRSTGPYS